MPAPGYFFAAWAIGPRITTKASISNIRRRQSILPNNIVSPVCKSPSNLSTGNLMKHSRCQRWQPLLLFSRHGSESRSATDAQEFHADKADVIFEFFGGRETLNVFQKLVKQSFGRQCRALSHRTQQPLASILSTV